MSNYEVFFDFFLAVSMLFTKIEINSSFLVRYSAVALGERAVVDRDVARAEQCEHERIARRCNAAAAVHDGALRAQRAGRLEQLAQLGERPVGLRGGIDQRLAVHVAAARDPAGARVACRCAAAVLVRR